jgi:hypothetical protein
MELIGEYTGIVRGRNLRTMQQLVVFLERMIQEELEKSDYVSSDESSNESSGESSNESSDEDDYQNQYHLVYVLRH